MSSTIQALLRDAKSAPLDFSLRLKLADWLQSHEQPEWADLVRRQCQRVIQFTELRTFVSAIDQQFSTDHEHDLVVRLRERFGLDGVDEMFFAYFERGLIQIDMPVELAAKPDQLPASVLSLLETGWVDGLCLLSGPEDGEHLAGSLSAPYMSQIIDLELRGYCGPGGARSIVESARLGQLKVLQLTHHSELGDEGAQQLASASNLSGLEALHLVDGCRVRGIGAAAIAASANLKNLNTFSIWNTDFTGDDCREFFENLHLPNLRAINFGFLDDAGAASLAASPAAAQLTELGFTSAMMSTAGVQALMCSRYLPRLTNLTIHTAPEAQSTESILRTVVQAPLWKQLEVFELLIDELLPSDMQALAETQPDTALRSLKFGCNKTLASNAVGPLIEFVNRSRLKHLDLGEACCDEEETMAMMTNLRSESLLSFDAWVSRDIVKDSLPALSRSSGLPNLMSLSLYTGVAARALAPLVFSPHFRKLAWLRTPLQQFGHYGDEMESWRSRLLPFNFTGDAPVEQQARTLLLAREQDLPWVRDAALSELEDLVQKELDLDAVPGLEAWLFDSLAEKNSVRNVLVHALERLGERDLERVWSKLAAWSNEAKPRSAKFRKEVIRLASRVIEGFFKNEDLSPERRAEIVNRGMQLLEGDLSDDDPEIIIEAVSGLKQICSAEIGAARFLDACPFPPQVEIRLTRMMSLPNSAVRSHVVSCFTFRSMSVDNLHHVLDWLKDTSAEVRWGALSLLRHSTLPPDFEGAIARLLDDADPTVQRKAIETVTSLPSLSPPTLDRLEQFLDSDDREVFEEVAETLVKHKHFPRSMLPGLQRWGCELGSVEVPGSFRTRFISILHSVARATSWPELVPALLRSLESPLTWLWRTSVEILVSQYGDQQQLPELLAQRLSSQSEKSVQVWTRHLVIKYPVLFDMVLNHLDRLQSPEVALSIREVLAVLRNPEKDSELQALMQAGDKFAAIKRYREIVNCSLAEAKYAIESALQRLN